MVEHPQLEWTGRFAYLAARYERDSIDLYVKDLIWLIAKKSYDGLKQPSDIYHNRNRTDTRGKSQIVNDILKHLGGE